MSGRNTREMPEESEDENAELREKIEEFRAALDGVNASLSSELEEEYQLRGRYVVCDLLGWVVRRRETKS